MSYNARKGCPLKQFTIFMVSYKALKQAVYWEYIRINSSKFCKPPRIERKELHPMDEKDIKKFLEAIS